MAEAIYVLCGVTSLACAGLLLNGWRRSRSRVLLWSALCFVCLAVNNSLLFVDLVLLPEVPLALLRNGFALAGVLVLLWGLVWEAP